MAELTTLARPYAKAAFEYAKASSALDSWAVSLGIAARVVADAKVMNLISDPSRTPQHLAGMILGVTEEDSGSSVGRFIQIMAENRRLSLLPEVNALFAQFKANLESSVDVEVVSAYELTDAEMARVASALKGKLNKDINVHTKTDAALLGGVIIRAGDMVIDGSVRGRLNKLAEAMNS